jgi:hypothetical protein
MDSSKAKGSSITPMEAHTAASSLTAKPTALESSTLLTAQSTKACGNSIINRARVKKLGLTVPPLKVIFTRGRRTARGAVYGQTGICLSDSLKMTRSVGKGSTVGMTGGSIRGSGVMGR